MAKKGRKAGVKTGAVRWSRRGQMEHLKIGESCYFVAEEGVSAQIMMARIAAVFRVNESIRQQGLSQRSGLVVFEGEVPRVVIRVTRHSDPQEVDNE